MDVIDKYFQVVGEKLDNHVMKYFGFNREMETKAELRLADKLGIEGIDEIMKEKTKNVINISSGGYDVNVLIKNWDINKGADEPDVYDNNLWYIDNIDVAVDPKSTVEVIGGNGHEYELGDLYNYSDIDELNANYNTEDNPITDDDIYEIGYEVQDLIRDWLYQEVYPLTGVNFEDVHPSNEKVDQLVESYGLNEQYDGYEVEPFALHSDIFEKMWNGFKDNNLLRTYLSLRMKFPKREKYVDYFYEFIRNNGEHIQRKEEEKN
jgi:hypothetical protein